MKTIYYYRDGSWSTQHKDGTTALNVRPNASPEQIQDQINGLLTLISL